MEDVRGKGVKRGRDGEPLPVLPGPSADPPAENPLGVDLLPTPGSPPRSKTTSKTTNTKTSTSKKKKNEEVVQKILSNSFFLFSKVRPSHGVTDFSKFAYTVDFACQIVGLQPLKQSTDTLSLEKWFPFEVDRFFRFDLSNLGDLADEKTILFYAPRHKDGSRYAIHLSWFTNSLTSFLVNFYCQVEPAENIKSQMITIKRELLDENNFDHMLHHIYVFIDECVTLSAKYVDEYKRKNKKSAMEKRTIYLVADWRLNSFEECSGIASSLIQSPPCDVVIFMWSGKMWQQLGALIPAKSQKFQIALHKYPEAHSVETLLREKVSTIMLSRSKNRTTESYGKKVVRYLSYGLRVIACLGEDNKVKESNPEGNDERNIPEDMSVFMDNQLKVVEEQLNDIAKKIGKEQDLWSRLHLAYFPHLNFQVKDLPQILVKINNLLGKHSGSADVKVLYGGPVAAVDDYCSMITELKFLDGFVVRSLEKEVFSKILKNIDRSI